MAGLGSINFGSLGGAVSDIFGGIGTLKGAKAFQVASQYSQKAAQYATENAGIAEASGRVKQLQAERQIYQVIGGQQADVAGAGFAKSGSALDLMRSSVEQGALTKALLENQTQIEVRGYRQEAEAKLAEAAQYQAQASAQKTSGIGGILGGIAKGIFSIFSDQRLKEDIRMISKRRDGIGVYSFRYRGSDARFIGLIAQDVARVRPEAVFPDPATGFLKVDYEAVDAVALLEGLV